MIIAAGAMPVMLNLREDFMRLVRVEERAMGDTCGMFAWECLVAVNWDVHREQGIRTVLQPLVCKCLVTLS
jgi:hypothetical protein